MKKRIFSMVLSAVLSLSLVACGSKEVETSSDVSQQTEESQRTEDIKEENTQIDQKTKDVEKPTEKEIEITMDNWQDYFEYRQEVTLNENENAFGEKEVSGISIQDGLFLKDEVKDNFVSCKVAFDVKETDEISNYVITYNLDSKEMAMELIDITSESEELILKQRITASKAAGDFKSGIIEKETSDKGLVIELKMIAYPGEVEFVEDNVIKFEAIAADSFDFEVTRVIGTITVLE